MNYDDWLTNEREECDECGATYLADCDHECEPEQPDVPDDGVCDDEW